MQIEPTVEDFAERYSRGEAQVIWTTLVADLETPVSAFLKIADTKPMSFLLESVEGGAVRGRYSIIGLDPDLVWRTDNGRAEINRNARATPDQFAPVTEPPLAALRALIAERRSVARASAVFAVAPFSGRTGVTTVIMSRTASNTTTIVGRMRIASGMPIGSGLGCGNSSICRTMS